MTIPLLSFFTGGGFLDMGFEAAGFVVVWTNEIDPDFADMYSHAISNWWKSFSGQDISVEITNRENIDQISTSQVLREAFGRAKPKIFGIIGGPPCPDFSVGGLHRGTKGKHGSLSQVFADKVCAIYPAFFIMENVSGLQKIGANRKFLAKMLSQFEERGYAIDLRILNALEYGVPQDRERLFVVGLKRSLGKDLRGKRFVRGERNWFNWPQPDFPGAKTLPWPDIANDGRAPRRPKGLPVELMVYTYLKGEPKPESLQNGREYFQPYSHRFRTQKEGDVRTKSFKRLHRYRYSPTAWYGNNEVHLHPWKIRRLSVREALRIQSIPDSYILPPDKSLSKKFKLICNGVPYLLAKCVAESLQKFVGPLASR
jgi:DNA (cytosine-5)-methyltransferase 1